MVKRLTAGLMLLVLFSACAAQVDAPKDESPGEQQELLCRPDVPQDSDPCDPADMVGGPEGCGLYARDSCGDCHTYCWRTGQCAGFSDCVVTGNLTGCCQPY